MPVSLTCSGCKVTLKLRDDLAGKKVKCPKCAKVLVVPQPELEELAPLEVISDDRIVEKPGARGRARDEVPHRGGIRKERDEERDVGNRKGRQKSRDEDDLNDIKIKKKKGKLYKPCPKCGAEGAERVLWTPWGSFYGPALFTHVQCPECGYCYNGKTGRSNALPAAIFVSLPLIGIIALIVGILYILMERGVMPKMW